LIRVLTLLVVVCLIAVRIGASTIEERVYTVDAYKICAERTLKIEGGDADLKGDAGGRTRYGVSLRFLKKLADTDRDGFVDGDLNRDGVVDEKDIEVLTLDDYYRIMKQYFWDVIPMDNFANEIEVQWKLFDLAIHASPQQSIRVFQRAVGAEPDGDIGEQTMAKFNAMPKDSVLKSFSYQQLRYYNHCIIDRPANFSFMANWTWRADQQL
jgi:lysozyme family protein